MDDRIRELLDRIRGSAQTAADTAADTARVAGRKAGQIVDVAKLNVQLFDLNSDLNEVLRRLGRVMYNLHLGQAEEGESVDQLLARADEINLKREEVKDRISALRQSRMCPSCGTACGRDDTFCKHCGAHL